MSNSDCRFSAAAIAHPEPFRDAYCTLAATASDGIAVLTATDTSPEFEQLLDNWICHVARAGIPPLVWSLDQATHNKLHPRKDVHTIFSRSISLSERAKPSAYKKPSSDEYTLAVALKPLVMARVLRLGFDLLFLDVDVAVLGDPRPWLQRSPLASLQLSLNYDDRPAQQRVTGVPDLNTGVVHVRRSPGTLALIDTWARRTADRAECPRRPPLWACGDQEQLTRLLRRCGWKPISFDAAARLRAANDAQDVRCAGAVGDLRVEVLPPFLFASGQTAGLWRVHWANTTRRVGGHVAPREVRTFHPNFGGFVGGTKRLMLQRLRHEGGGTGWCTA